MSELKTKKRFLLAIVGPTAVGKTEIAIEVAQKLNSVEIISADSLQVYRYMNIGTAKPTLEQRQSVRHHLIDIIDPDEEFSVADYQRMALKTIENIHSSGKVPILVGGTGLYVKAVTDEYAFSMQGKNFATRKKLKEKAERQGVTLLYDELKKIDPESASKIHPNDLRRIIRALEVYYSTGETISDQLKKTNERSSSFNLLIIGLFMKRDELYERINHRVDLMLKEGFLEEVEDLLARNYSATLKSMQGLGYKHLASFLRKEISFEEAKRTLKRDTRRFAKRQLTWFKGDHRIRWLDTTDRAQVSSLAANVYAMAEGNFSIDRE